MRLVICDTAKDMSEWAAMYIMKRIKDFNPNEDKYFVMGLGQGSTPVWVYKKLIEYHKAGRVSFKYVKTFNMAEFVGLPIDHSESSRSSMRNSFSKHIDIDQENVYELNGNATDLVAECKEYEKKIEEVGGIELFLSGVGFDGHVAYDEAGSSLVSRTRVKTLSRSAATELAVCFENDMNKVPKQALTVGIGTMMDSKEVMVVFSGPAKAIALQRAIEEGVNHISTVSAFQQHPRTIMVCDEDATLELRVKTAKYFKNLWDVHSKLIEESSV